MNKLGPYELNKIYVGDARILAKGIPDESVDLIFTDPIYQNIDDYQWLAELAARILKKGKSLLALAGNLEKPSIYDKMRPYLDYHWEAAIMYRGANSFMNSRAIQVSWKPILWFTKGKREEKWCKDSLLESSAPKILHRWQQSISSAIWFIRQLTDIGDIVVDPFCGFGSYPIACKQLGRPFLAFEINPETAKIARQQLAQMQLPLFIQELEQIGMNI